MKVIARIKGGLGNQLFCYAAARRLALVNNVDLLLDDVSGFARDYHYRRQYLLDKFRIPARKATAVERLEPFERYRRGLAKWLSRKTEFSARRYLEQEGLDFDPRVLDVKVRGTLYVDGLWQSEGYFKDIEQIIREDLRIIPPIDTLNRYIAEKIEMCHAVAIHVRWFDAPGSKTTHNAHGEYYRRAVAVMEQNDTMLQYFVFSDNPEAARALLDLPKNRVTLVAHNKGNESAYADLWLMSKCKHFIIANSTFSWWGAWLGNNPDKRVVAPGLEIRQDKTSWGFDGLLPAEWIRL